jgi:hypothetical protein
MKKFNFIIVFVFFVNVLFPQNQYSPAVEIFVGTESVVPQSKNITFYLTKYGPVFGDKINGVKYYYVTQYYHFSSYMPLTNNNPISNWAGWDFVFSQTVPPTFPVFGFGLYGLTTDDSNSQFFIDYRDSRYGTYQGSDGHDADIWIKYNDSNNTFYYNSDGSPNAFNQILNKEYLNIWTIKGQGTPSTMLFQNYWANSLGLIPSQTGNHPRLVWGPYQESGITVQSYKIYRKVGSGNFSLIHTNNES